MPTQKYFFGWLPDLPDHRDLPFKATLTPEQLPAKVDLRDKCPDVYDQGRLGSCTANAIAGAIEYEMVKENAPRVFTSSRLFIYYNERELEGSATTDSGAYIRDGIKTVNHEGVCPEKNWPYDISKFAIKPPLECYTMALKNTVSSYLRLTNSLNILKACLAEGFPFVFGFTVYANFYATGETGYLTMPGPADSFEGGHAVMAVGYDDAENHFIIRNSWGADWGINGYYKMPYAYLTNSNLADDFWTIRMISEADDTKVVKTGKVTAIHLNVRSRPSTSGKIVQVLSEGDEIHVYAIKGSWYRIDPKKQQWVSSKYIA